LFQNIVAAAAKVLSPKQLDVGGQSASSCQQHAVVLRERRWPAILVSRGMCCIFTSWHIAKHIINNTV